MTEQPNIPVSEPPVEASPSERPARVKKQPAAFWTVASVLSLIVNIVLIVLVVILAANLFTIKTSILQPLINGLYTNFELMDAAHIRTTIPVSADVPAQFDLPLDTDTVVKLTEDTSIPGATVSVYTGGMLIQNAQADIILPAGTNLPIHLTMTVPVDQTIPVDLTVDVDIPLNQTELHEPFVGLQGVVAPYKSLLEKLPGSWKDVFRK